MNAGGGHHQCDVGAVIDDKRDFRRPQNRRYFFGLFEDSPRVRPLVPKLRDSGSSVS